MAVKREENIFLDRFETECTSRMRELIQVLADRDQVMEQSILEAYRKKRLDCLTLIQSIKNGDTSDVEKHLKNYKPGRRHRLEDRDYSILITAIFVEELEDIEVKTFEDDILFDKFIVSVTEHWRDSLGKIEEVVQDNIEKTALYLHGVLVKNRRKYDKDIRIEKIRSWNFIDKFLLELERRFEYFYQAHLAMRKKILKRLSRMNPIEYGMRIEIGIMV